MKGVKLGYEVKDVVSGFQGIVVAELRRLEGVIEMGVLPSGAKDKLATTQYFDVCRLEKIGDGVHVKAQTRVMGFHHEAGDVRTSA